MNPLDIAILVLVTGLTLLGLLKGLVRLVLGAGSLLSAWWVAVNWFRPLAHSLPAGEVWGTAVEVLVFVVLFAAVVVAVSLLARFVVRILQQADLRWLDRIAGGLLGLATALALSAGLLLVLAGMLPAAHPLLGNSRLAPHVFDVADLLLPLVPRDVEEAYRRQRLTPQAGSASHSAPAGQLQRGQPLALTGAAALH